MEKLENRNNIRLNNQLTILNLLRREKMTITDLADNLEVSFSAARRIIDEMISGGLVKYSSKQSVNPRGRIPCFVEINTKIGVVCAIDYSTPIVKVLISSLEGKLIVSKSFPHGNVVTKDLLAEIEETIKELMEKPEVKKSPLLSICISSPGVIDNETFKYISVFRVKDFETMDPVSYFSNIFNVPTTMYNDIRLGCLAELKYGAFPRGSYFNGMFLHIGSSAGLSFVFNGHLFEGSNGFAGEMPLYNVNDSLAASHQWNNRIFCFWDIVNYIRNAQNIQDLPLDDTIDFDKVFEDYRNGDELTHKAVDLACKYNALNIIGLSSLFDLDVVIIEGPILAIDENIISKISKYVSELSVHGIRTRIMASPLGEESSTIGATYQAISTYLYKTLEKINCKRLNTSSFAINPAFKEI